MSKDNNMTFWLNLQGETEIDYNAVGELLGCEVKEDLIYSPVVDYSKTEEFKFYSELVWLLDLIEPHQKELCTMGINLNESTIWMIYEYFAQCNMEFDSDVLERIGKLGLKLCVSCYEDSDLSVRESFEQKMTSEATEGVWLSSTIGSDVKVGEIFPVDFEIENTRNDHSFIFTTLDISDSIFGNFEYVRSSIEPVTIEKMYDSTSFLFDRIIKPNETVKISVYLKAIKAGVFRGETTIQEKYNYIENELVVVVED